VSLEWAGRLSLLWWRWRPGGFWLWRLVNCPKPRGHTENGLLRHRYLRLFNGGGTESKIRHRYLRTQNGGLFGDYGIISIQSKSAEENILHTICNSEISGFLPYRSLLRPVVTFADTELELENGGRSECCSWEHIVKAKVRAVGGDEVTRPAGWTRT
jgi:hypothetical protein